MESIKNPLSRSLENKDAHLGVACFLSFGNINLEMCKNVQNKYKCNLFIINVINNKYTLQKHGVL